MDPSIGAALSALAGTDNDARKAAEAFFDGNFNANLAAVR
jgi:hypothetical protein